MGDFEVSTGRKSRTTKRYTIVRDTIKDETRRKHFEEILKQWCNVIERYTAAIPDDALYWYNERATLSSFSSAASSAAAARENFHVLEEYRAKKGNREGTGKSTGRVDLWIGWNRKRERLEKEYIFEAKQTWCPISNTAKPCKKIKGHLKKAINEAKRSKNSYASDYKKSRAYGMVFAVPYLKKSFHEDSGCLIQKFIKDLETIDYDALAYVFPGGPEIKNIKRTHYPGVVCIIRAIRRY